MPWGTPDPVHGRDSVLAEEQSPPPAHYPDHRVASSSISSILLLYQFLYFDFNTTLI